MKKSRLLALLILVLVLCANGCASEQMHTSKENPNSSSIKEETSTVSSLPLQSPFHSDSDFDFTPSKESDLLSPLSSKSEESPSEIIDPPPPREFCYEDLQDLLFDSHHAYCDMDRLVEGELRAAAVSAIGKTVFSTHPSDGDSQGIVSFWRLPVDDRVPLPIDQEEYAIVACYRCTDNFWMDRETYFAVEKVPVVKAWGERTASFYGLQFDQLFEYLWKSHNTGEKPARYCQMLLFVVKLGGEESAVFKNSQEQTVARGDVVLFSEVFFSTTAEDIETLYFTYKELKSTEE